MKMRTFVFSTIDFAGRISSLTIVDDSLESAKKQFSGRYEENLIIWTKIYEMVLVEER